MLTCWLRLCSIAICYPLLLFVFNCQSSRVACAASSQPGKPVRLRSFWSISSLPPPPLLRRTLVRLSRVLDGASNLTKRGSSIFSVRLKRTREQIDSIRSHSFPYQFKERSWHPTSDCSVRNLGCVGWVLTTFVPRWNLVQDVGCQCGVAPQEDTRLGFAVGHQTVLSLRRDQMERESYPCWTIRAAQVARHERAPYVLPHHACFLAERPSFWGGISARRDIGSVLMTRCPKWGIATAEMARHNPSGSELAKSSIGTELFCRTLCPGGLSTWQAKWIPSGRASVDVFELLTDANPPSRGSAEPLSGIQQLSRIEVDRKTVFNQLRYSRFYFGKSDLVWYKKSAFRRR